MKRIAIVAMLISLVGASLAAGPELTLKETEFDFGIAPQNAKVAHTFWLYSTGDEELLITKVIPGCGCTKAPLEKDALAPGDSTRLEIIFSTKRYSKHISKKPRIESNGTISNHSIVITADIATDPKKIEPLKVSPYKLNLSQYNNTERKKMNFHLTNDSDKDINVKVVAAPSDVVSFKIPDKIAAGASEKAEITLTETGQSTEWSKSITLELDDEYATRLSIPINRQIKSATVTPASAKVESKEGK